MRAVHIFTYNPENNSHRYYMDPAAKDPLRCRWGVFRGPIPACLWKEIESRKPLSRVTELRTTEHVSLSVHQIFKRSATILHVPRSLYAVLMLLALGQNGLDLRPQLQGRLHSSRNSFGDIWRSDSQFHSSFPTHVLRARSTRTCPVSNVSLCRRNRETTLSQCVYQRLREFRGGEKG